MLQCVRTACLEVLASEDLAVLIYAVLDLGNLLNAGTSRGGARAFRFDALHLLPTTKSADKKSSALKFLLAQLEVQRGIDLSTFLVRELPSLQEACSIQVRDSSATSHSALHSRQLHACWPSWELPTRTCPPVFIHTPCSLTTMIKYTLIFYMLIIIYMYLLLIPIVITLMPCLPCSCPQWTR